MSSWRFSNLGASCLNKDKKTVKQLLECCGVIFNEYLHGSEVGEINIMEFTPEIMGEIKFETDKVLDIFYLINTIFEDVTIYYEYEEGNNTSDCYLRKEIIYKPSTKRMLIGELEYEYGTYEAFGKTVYEILKKKMEDRAKAEGIEPKWEKDDYYLYPATDEFYDICEEVLEQNGGLEGLGTKKSSKKIPKREINVLLAMKAIENANKLGYTELATLIRKEVLGDE